ncbi:MULTISPECIES: hypothetical protein [unclassified Guyparkeria]|uniref:hypothetical protein n=1 Tax=unclassified Guyparkeria TaxID=2626246 RepID=UPI0007337302|nr:MULTISPECIES: hypothetical protein [unclassified Guyparkeria]KTG17127.1 hypothetical protein AUR63_10290 [Guyparkeria sp. XI15]OAE86662.1 hypothetical protein AWR35_10305 [Guyparkeria sp. WRN-7]
MRRFGKLLIAASAGLLIGQANAMAQPPEHAGQNAQGNPGQHAQGNQGQSAMGNAPQRERYHISTRERSYIRDWYSRNLPPGLAKQGKIPPGHAKRLERGSPWPPRGVEYEPLPRELVRDLSPLPDHMRYYRVGTDVVIADMAGEVVSDVVYGVLNR